MIAYRTLHHLQPGETLGIMHGSGIEVVVHAGSLWMTQPRDPHDHVMLPGKSAHLLSAGVVLLYAFEDTEVVLAGRAAPRVERWKRGEWRQVTPSTMRRSRSTESPRASSAAL